MGFGEVDEPIIVSEYKQLPQPNMPGQPNRRYDLYRNGQLHSSRWTDGRGRPYRDRDFNHSGDGHGFGFPHDHWWFGNYRGDAVSSEIS